MKFSKGLGFLFRNLSLRQSLIPFGNFLFVLLLIIGPNSALYGTPSAEIPYTSKFGKIIFVQKTYYGSTSNAKLRTRWRKLHFESTRRLYESLPETIKPKPFEVEWEEETTARFYKKVVNHISDSPPINRFLHQSPHYRNLISFSDEDLLKTQPVSSNGVDVILQYDGTRLTMKFVAGQKQCTFDKHLILYKDLPANFKISSRGNRVAFQVRNGVSIVNLADCSIDSNTWIRKVDTGNDESKSKYLGHRKPSDIRWLNDRFLLMEFDEGAHRFTKFFIFDAVANNWFEGPQVDYRYFDNLTDVKITEHKAILEGHEDTSAEIQLDHPYSQIQLPGIRTPIKKNVGKRLAN